MAVIELVVVAAPLVVAAVLTVAVLAAAVVLVAVVLALAAAAALVVVAPAVVLGLKAEQRRLVCVRLEVPRICRKRQRHQARCCHI